MSRRRDPVQQRDDGSMDLQDITEWKPESLPDRIIYRLYALLLSAFRGLLVLAGFLILASQFAFGGLDSLTDPVVGLFVVLSAFPALLLAVYIWHADVTTPEPPHLLVVTFALGLLFAGFAGVLNSVVFRPALRFLFGIGVALPVALSILFLLVVAPIEETVKLLAVRVYAYRKPEFNAVIAGAVYGAAAGLGFATIENAIYITRVADTTASFGTSLFDGGSITTQRALAGPGHVVYSAFAGYYLGLAKFNREYAGPIVLKGLLAAAFIHGWYNILVGAVPEYIAAVFGISGLAATFTFIIAYDGIFIAILIRRLSQYRAAYEQVHADSGGAIPSERTEFE